MDDHFQLPPNLVLVDSLLDPNSLFPPIYRALQHPFSNCGHSPVDVFVIRVNPIDLKKQAERTLEFAQTIPSRPTLEWAEQHGIRRLDKDFLLLTRLVKDGANTTDDLHLASWSSPEYMTRNTPHGTIVKLESVLVDILGERDGRTPTEQLPWEKLVNSGGNRQATRNHLTTTAYEAPRNVFEPCVNASSRLSEKALEMTQTLNKCAFTMGMVHQQRLPPSQVKFMNDRCQWFNHPCIGVDNNLGCFNQSQANFGPFLRSDDTEGLQASQGNASHAHPDDKDDPAAWSFFLPLHDVDESTSEQGWMINIDFGIMFPLRRLSGGAMNGRCLHVGIPCSSSNLQTAPWQTRFLMILYSHERSTNGKSVKPAGFTTSHTIAEVDSRVLAHPELLQRNDRNTTFMRDLRAIMENDTSALNYKLRLASELFLGVLSGITEYELDIPLNTLISNCKYRARNDQDAQWIPFQAWPDAPNIRDEDIAKRQEHYEKCDHEVQRASLRIPHLVAGLPEAVVQDASVIRVNYKKRKERLDGDDGEDTEPRPKPPRDYFMYKPTSTPPKVSRLTELNERELIATGKAMQVALDEIHNASPLSSHAHLRVTRMHFGKLSIKHFATTDDANSFKALSNARLMLMHYGGWLHLREIENLLINQQHTIGDIVDPLQTGCCWWNDDKPWELRLLRIVYNFASARKEDRKRGKTLRTHVAPEDVIEGVESDASLSISLAKVCYMTVADGGFDLRPWYWRLGFAIERTLNIIARWKGLQLGEEGAGWHLWTYRGKLILAILQSGQLGLLAQDEVLSCFHHIRKNKTLQELSVAKLVQEFDFSNKPKFAKWSRLIDENSQILRESIDCLEDLENRSKSMTLIDIATFLREQKLPPDINIDVDSQANFAGTAGHIISKFLQLTLPLLEDGHDPTIVTQWITKADSGLGRATNGTHPIRRLGSDRAFIRNEFEGHRDTDSMTVAFSTLVHVGITLNSDFMASPFRRFFFRDVEDFRAVADGQESDFMCSKHPFAGQYITQRNCDHVDTYFAAAVEWNAELVAWKNEHDDDLMPFRAAYDFFIGRRLPAISDMTTWVLVCDLVAVEQVQMPSPSELWLCLAKSYKKMASKAILVTLCALPQPLELCTCGNATAFEALYRDVSNRLEGDAPRLLPDVIHFEHTLCKLKQFRGDYPDIVAAWAAEVPCIPDEPLEDEYDIEPESEE